MIILYGHQACGKTYYGKLLARDLGCCFVDTDQLMEAQYGMSCRQIAKKWGEPFFRQVEAEIIQNLEGNGVIAIGGGAILNEASYLKLKACGTLVYLELDKDEVKKRCLANGIPSYLDSEASFEKMYEERRVIYEKLSPYKVTLTGKSDSQVLEEITSLT